MYSNPYITNSTYTFCVQLAEVKKMKRENSEEEKKLNEETEEFFKKEKETQRKKLLTIGEYLSSKRGSSQKIAREILKKLESGEEIKGANLWKDLRYEERHYRKDKSHDALIAHEGFFPDRYKTNFDRNLKQMVDLKFVKKRYKVIPPKRKRREGYRKRKYNVFYSLNKDREKDIIPELQRSADIEFLKEFKTNEITKIDTKKLGFLVTFYGKLPQSSQEKFTRRIHRILKELENYAPYSSLLIAAHYIQYPKTLKKEDLEKSKAELKSLFKKAERKNE